MSYLNNYRDRLKCKNSTEENRMIGSVGKEWDKNNPSAREVKVLRTDGVFSKVRIQTGKKTVGIDKIFIHPEDKIYSGDIIFNLQERNWIVLSVSFIGHIFQSANIFRINRVLKWQINGKLYEQLVAVKPFSRAEGTKDFEFFTEPTDSLSILFPNNSKLSTIKRDARFMIDGLPYKVTKFVRTQYEGTTVLYVAEDLKNENDTDSVADFIKNENEPITESFIQGKNEIIYGFSEEYSLLVDGELVSPTWSLDPSSKWAKLKQENGKATVSISKSLDHIGKTIELKASYNEKEYSTSLIVRSLM